MMMVLYASSMIMMNQIVSYKLLLVNDYEEMALIKEIGSRIG
jgi:hypothetical protein